MKPILDQLVAQLLPIVVTALGGVLIAACGMAVAYLKSKTKNTKVQGALDRLDQVMEDAVKSTQQSIVSSIKPGDTAAQALADAKAAAIASAKSHYGAQGIAELKKVLGWDDILLEKNLSTKLESKVHDMKQSQAPANGVKA